MQDIDKDNARFCEKYKDNRDKSTAVVFDL